MSRSEPKPKIIYKNLEDLIKNNSLCKNGSSKRYNTQRVNTQTLTDVSNLHPSNKSDAKQVKYIKISRTETNNPLQPHLDSSIGLYSSSYNQIDAIFTQLQDFFCQSKEKVLDQVKVMLRNKHQSKKSQTQIKQRVEDIRKMSDYVKHISKYFVEGQIPNMPEGQEQNSYSITKNTGLAKSTVPTQIYEDESVKLTHMSLKNSKIRANRRGQLINNRKKTVYQLILDQKQSKIKSGHSQSKRKLQTN